LRGVDVYAQGLQRLPENDHLTNNSIATWNAFADSLMNAKNWDGAIKVYEEALSAFPDSSLLNNNLDYCRQQMSKR
jgi:pentatricopeptide repeat protein